MAALLTAGLLMPACATDANDVTACRQLEDARCTRAVSCGIDLQTPLHAGGSASDAITSCQLFYQDACLHGLATTVTPTTDQLGACLNMIMKPTSSCNYVVNPQSEPECSWLLPPDAGVDASDASTDVAVSPEVIVVYVYPDATISDGAAEAADCVNECEGATCPGDESACYDECMMQCDT
jgi:hypothetical protein